MSADLCITPAAPLSTARATSARSRARGFDVTGVEYSSQGCEAARQGLATAGLHGEVLRGEIDDIADRTSVFDACLITDLIERVRDPRRFLEIVHRVLRPGGVVFITTPSRDSWSAKLMPARRINLKPERLFYFNRKTLEGLLFSEGFRTLVWERNLCSDERGIVASGMIMMARKEEKRAQPLLSIIMPVFNEAATFRDAFEQLLAHRFAGFDVEYVVVESNSTDGTRAIVNEYVDRPGVRVILEDRPRGKGHAVRTGLKAARGDFIAIQDADLEYDLEDYDALLEPLLHNREAFVLGARHGGRAWKMRQFTGQPIASLLMNFGHWFFTMLLNVCYGVWLKDPFTMYKIFRRDCIHGLEFESNRFDFDWEIVIKLIRRGYIPLEIPVNYRSRSFKEGKKVSVIRDPLTWLRAVIRFRFVAMPRWAPVAESTTKNSEPTKAS
jgi:SAM-dependent methyltransferase